MTARYTISIAVLSENQDDVERINSTLRSAGHAAHCHWIDRPNKLANTLADARIELIIVNCDNYRDPIRSIIKEKDFFDPEVPVIALKEQADELAIHDAMKSGAVDLVSIGMKKRLTAVVTRELRALRAERALNSTIMSASGYKQQVRDLMQASAAAIALVQEGIIVDANDAWLNLFKVASAEEVTGLPLMDNFESESHAALKGALIATVTGKWQRDEKLDAKPRITGESEPLHLGFAKIDYDGAPCVQISIALPEKSSQDSTRVVHEALQRDPTTLFFHRAQFLERLEKRLRRKPASGLHLVAYVKPDRFRQMRDTFGIIASEELLAQFSEILRTRQHPRDVAGRIEGTSIMVLLERGNAQDGQVWGQQLVDNVHKTTFAVADKSAQMTCTVGVCAVSEAFGSLEELVSAVVDAHASGKEAGGNVSVLSEDSGGGTKQRELDAIWVKYIRAALMENRFRLAKLPIAGLRSDSVEMYDMLVRMIDEQGNSVLPSEFLPAADRNNLIKNIDRWMVKAAVEFCEENDADRVFVRLSSQSIADSGTADWMQKEFDGRDFDCSRLVIQVPERDAAQYIKPTKALVQKLKLLGVGFALEHYGIDQERFRILDLLTPDYIKIDGELMHSLMTDLALQASVEKIIQAASERNIRTIAERVENANAMAVLFQLGLDYMQGHYIHEPEVVLEDQRSGNVRSLADLQAANSN